LGAEQIAEGFHWRHEVEVERQALRAEVQSNLTVVAYRRSEQSCIDARLAQIAEVFARHARGQPLGLKGRVARPPLWTASAATWDIAVSGQALGHMPQKEKLGFSETFNTFRSFSRLRDEEDADWRSLALLDHVDLLDANDWSKLHEAWGHAVGIGDRMRSIMDDIQQNLSLGEHARPPHEDQPALHDAFCAPLIG
jgi:hypothetical protein